ncbi:protein-tyrosine phosphatase [Nonomuraea thailandensis]|uniref:Protein-tyrosine phosphatase n=1 Tax=Nonomuraea thailandensis TaxID=1188745 RepID=A0A9X2GII2_9ACTN|nr:tyrosine-protein phosphatase [Nonomuraea thailandensis]MCP2358340.1 protein-tyrosine phosphatase [Nonomuraea thailandensis]
MSIPSFTLSPLANLRDLGGIPVAGGTVRTGLVLRSDDVCIIDVTSARTLVEDGLSLLIDLRSPEELARTGRGALQAHTGVRHLHLPLMAEITGGTSELMQRMIDASDPAAEFGRWYARVMRTCGHLIVQGLSEIAQADGAALFHCAAGKDRTGKFAASLLAVLGAGEEAIVADYVRTDDVHDALMARLAGLMQPFLGDLEAYRATMPPELNGAKAETMHTMLAELGGTAGLVELLREAGLTPQTQARLRERLIEPGSPSAAV